MTQSIVGTLDQLQLKVERLVKALADSQSRENRLKHQIQTLSEENNALHEKVGTAQDQVNHILNQWFPELETKTGAKHGNS